MKKDDILEYFKDINEYYNNSTVYDTLKRMLNEFEDDLLDRVDCECSFIVPGEMICYEMDCEDEE